MTRRIPLARAAALIALGLCAAAAFLPPNDGPLDEWIRVLRDELEGAVASNGWQTAQYSVLALSLETGDTLFAHRAREALAPASNMKLLTSAAALHHLGPDFRYRTFLLASGPIEDGRLKGDLILYGTGDPGSSDQIPGGEEPLQALADSLLAAGVHVVEGDVVGDGSFFTGPLRANGWEPEDLNDWFAAPTSGLSFNENVVTLRIVPTGTGSPPEVRTIPEGADLPVQLTAVTGGSGGRVQIRRPDPGEPISISGSLSRGGREVWRQMTVSDPPRYAASIFRHVLQSRGISVLGEVRGVSDPAGSEVTDHTLWAPALRSRPAPRLIASHRSPPLLNYLKIVNKKSHNLFAELTLKTLGRVVGGEGSYVGGAQVLSRFLDEEVRADTTGLHVVDGSGLSALNRVSAATFVDVLGHMARTPLWDAYWETLPEAGNPRELRRMYRTPAAGNLRAKTGTIARVSALSGVVRSANGERILFSIIANDVPSTYGAKRIEDRIGARLASFERPFEPGPRELRAAAAPPPATGAEAIPAAGAVPTRTHTVANGENLTVIARRYAITLNALVEANPGLSPRRLMPGVRLVVPAPAPSDDPTPPAERTDVQTHRIRSGDSFWTIARAYGVSLNELIAANPEVNPRRIQPGQTIRVPSAPEH